MTDVMDLKEIETVEIPDGIYKLALEDMREWYEGDNIYPTEFSKSYRTAFTALLKLSRGEYVERKSVMEEIEGEFYVQENSDAEHLVNYKLLQLKQRVEKL